MSAQSLLKVACVLLFAAPWVRAQPAPPGFTLPDTVYPVRYALDLHIQPEHPAFSGTVSIDLVVQRRTSVFWLNAKDLTMREATIASGGSSTPLRLLTGNGEVAGFETASPLEPGPSRVFISFNAKLSQDASVGAFRRQFGEDWYVFTTFTAIEARRAFPCFDEPRYKTPWELTLHVRREHVALANSPVVSETGEPNGMKKVVFAPTPALPSEVVAFAVGPFEVVDAGLAGSKHIPVRIITPRGRAREAEAARTATPEILARLEEYTGIPYPWAKLDHIALTRGAYGAVENPGLITYQQAILLAEPGHDTADRQFRMRSVMAHELAHQWFGNLVTQASWTDVWLSEGFATWLGTRTIDLDFPPDQRTLAANLRQAGLSVDRADRNWPVRRPISSREQAATVYNGLVYSKAAAVLDNLELWLGDSVLQRGLRKYLAAHAFGNASTDDLAVALSSESGADVGPVLHSLLDHAGVPVLDAALDCRRLNIQPTQWTLPVCLHWAGGGHQCAVIQPGQTSLEIKSDSCPAWLWTNAEGRGFYRSQLTPANLDKMALAGYTELTAAERRSLIADVGAMVAAGQFPAKSALDILTTVVNDPEPRVTIELLRIAAALGPLVPLELRAKYSAWLQQVYGIPTPAPQQEVSLREYLQNRTLKTGKSAR